MTTNPSTNELSDRVTALETSLEEARAGHEKLRSLFQQMAHGYCELELLRGSDGHAVDQRYIEFNPAFERLFGISIEFATGRTASEVFPGLEPWWHEAFDRIVKARRPDRIEHKFAALGRWFEVFVYPQGGDRLTVMYEDITERKRAEEASRNSEARLAAAFESVPAGVAMIDMAGRVVIDNAEYRRFLPTGIIPSRDPQRGVRWRAWDAEGRLIEPSNYPGARALRGERVIPGQEMLHTDDDGREIWTRVAAVPLRDAAGKVTGQSSVISDIDALKRIAEAFRESEDRQTFLLGFSDALRSLADPIAIIGEACRLLGGHLGVDRAYYVEVDEFAGLARVERDFVREGAPSLAGTHQVSDFGWSVEILRRGECHVISDTQSSPLVPDRDRPASAAL